MKRYLFITVGDVDPEIKGPYKDEEARAKAAKAYKQNGDEDGIFMLDIANDGTPWTCPYASSFFES